VASHPPGPASGRLTQGSRASNPPDPRPCLAFPIATSWSPPAASPTAGPTADRPEPTPLPPADPDHAADPDPAISRFRQLAATPPRLLRSDSRTLPPSERSATRRPRAPVRTSNDAVFVCHAPRETRNATAFRARARPKTRELSRRGDHRIVPAAPAPVPRGHELTRAWTLRQAHPAVDAPLEPVTTGRLAASAPRATSIRPAPSHHHRGPASARASRGVSTHHRARHARRAGVQALLCRARWWPRIAGRPARTDHRAGGCSTLRRRWMSTTRPILRRESARPARPGAATGRASRRAGERSTWNSRVPPRWPAPRRFDAVIGGPGVAIAAVEACRTHPDDGCGKPRPRCGGRDQHGPPS